MLPEREATILERERTLRALLIFVATGTHLAKYCWCTPIPDADMHEHQAQCIAIRTALECGTARAYLASVEQKAASC